MLTVILATLIGMTIGAAFGITLACCIVAIKDKESEGK